MQPRIGMITLGVRDLRKAVCVYGSGGRYMRRRTRG